MTWSYQLRRAAEKRETERKMIDARSPSVPWPFPIVSDMILCGSCGLRFRGNHDCPVRK